MDEFNFKCIRMLNSGSDGEVVVDGFGVVVITGVKYVSQRSVKK